MNQADRTQIATNKAALIIQMETTPRMTKRLKTFKPKQKLKNSEVQSLVVLLKAELENLEWSVGHFKRVAVGLKGYYNDESTSEHFFKKADKARKARNKLAVIQAKLKRGLA